MIGTSLIFRPRVEQCQPKILAP